MIIKPYYVTKADLLSKGCGVAATGNTILMCPKCYNLYKMSAHIKVIVKPSDYSSITSSKIVLKHIARCRCGHDGEMIRVYDLLENAVSALNRLQYYSKSSCLRYNRAGSMLCIDFEKQESFSDLPLGWSQTEDGKRLESYDERSVAINNLYSWLYTLKRCGKEQ